MSRIVNGTGQLIGKKKKKKSITKINLRKKIITTLLMKCGFGYIWP
jgi:hypothetical protein